MTPRRRSEREIIRAVSELGKRGELTGKLHDAYNAYCTTFQRVRKVRTPKDRKTIGQLKVQLWDVLSQFIRLRDAADDLRNGNVSDAGYVRCRTCGEVMYWSGGRAQAGHWISRGKQATKYNEENVHTQCQRCNGPGAGEPDKMELYIRSKYGDSTADNLIKFSRLPVKRGRDLYVFKIAQYTERVERLKSELGV